MCYKINNFFNVLIIGIFNKNNKIIIHKTNKIRVLLGGYLKGFTTSGIFYAKEKCIILVFFTILPIKYIFLRFLHFILFYFKYVEKYPF